MPTIPDIQTLTNQNVRQELADGGFARQNLFQVFIENGWGKKTLSKLFWPQANANGQVVY